MRLFLLALSVSGLMAACSGTSADELFDQGGAGGNGPGSGGNAAIGGAAGVGGVFGDGGSSGGSGVGGSSGGSGAGGSSGGSGVGGSSGGSGVGGSSGGSGVGGSNGGFGVGGSNGNAGSLGAAGAQGFGGSGATQGSSGTGGVQGSSGSSGSLGSGGSSTGGTGGVIDPGDAGTDSSVDAGRRCPAGNYTGSLSGPYRSRLGNSTFTARLEFTINGEGGVLGKITATSAGSGRANFGGKIDCQTGALAADITEGTYSDALGTLRYTGKMSATYDPGTQSFPNGTFTVTETNPMYGGEGTWTATASSG